MFVVLKRERRAQKAKFHVASVLNLLSGQKRHFIDSRTHHCIDAIPCPSQYTIYICFIQTASSTLFHITKKKMLWGKVLRRRWQSLNYNEWQCRPIETTWSTNTHTQRVMQNAKLRHTLAKQILLCSFILGSDWQKNIHKRTRASTEEKWERGRDRWIDKKCMPNFCRISILGDVFFALHILYSGRRCPNTNHHYAYQEHRSNDGSRPILCHSAVDVV